MRSGTRAALVACTVAGGIAAALPVAAAAARPAPTYVLRGVVVQYIPPAGSTVGSLSVRVTRVRGAARRLTGELVTVAIVPGGSAQSGRQTLPEGAICTLVLRAPSPASILKGAGALRDIVLVGPAAPSPTPTPAGDGNPGQANDPTADGGSSADHGTNKAGNDTGQAKGGSDAGKSDSGKSDSGKTDSGKSDSGGGSSSGSSDKGSGRH